MAVTAAEAKGMRYPSTRKTPVLVLVIWLALRAAESTRSELSKQKLN